MGCQCLARTEFTSKTEKSTKTNLKNVLHLIQSSLSVYVLLIYQIYHLAYLAFQDRFGITQYDFSITGISIDHKLFLCHLFVLLVLDLNTIYTQNRMIIHQINMIHLLDSTC